MLEYPTITPSYLLAAITQGKICLATKTRPYYQKLIGGLACSNAEQLKLTLLIHVLDSVYKLDMTCFDESPVDNTLTYNQIFINHLAIECKDCGFAFNSEFLSTVSEQTLSDSGITGTDYIPPDAPEGSLNYILLESGDPIQEEDSSDYFLVESP